VPAVPQTMLGAALDEQRDEVADGTAIEFGPRLLNGAGHLMRRRLRERVGQPLDDLADRTVFP
jgi:hypothetical protein